MNEKKQSLKIAFFCMLSFVIIILSLAVYNYCNKEKKQLPDEVKESPNKGYRAFKDIDMFPEN